MFQTFFNIAILRGNTSFYKTLADGYVQKLLQLFSSVVSVWNYFRRFPYYRYGKNYLWNIL